MGQITELTQAPPTSAPKQKVILIEDQEKDFVKISQILEDLGCEVVLSYDQVNKIRANYNAFRKVAAHSSKIFRKAVDEAIGPYLDDDYIWIIDICWVDFPNRPVPDKYGFDFLREYGIKKVIMVSLADIDRFRSELEGIRFVCKVDSSGMSFSDSFKKQLRDELADLRTDNYNPTNHENDENPY